MKEINQFIYPHYDGLEVYTEAIALDGTTARLFHTIGADGKIHPDYEILYDRKAKSAKFITSRNFLPINKPTDPVLDVYSDSAEFISMMQ